MKWYGFIFIAVALIGAVNVVYHIYKMTILDAASRGLKYPRFWGLFTIGGQNSGGLLLYLIGRGKYPSSMNETEHMEIASRKNKILVGLIFLAVGAVGLIICMVLL